jgi:UDP-2-acetamido-3-amino-2,3-dideoxy-glucuronate N-acetyltransferase
MENKVFVHAKAINESEQVGGGTRIWAFAHVMRGAVIGTHCNIGDHAFIECGAVLGDGVTVKNGVLVWEGVELEDFVFVGPATVFTNDRFPRSPRNPVVHKRYQTKAWLERTRVREGASLGANCTLVCGVTIGRYAMVAAGAVVRKDVPNFRIVAGCPAREIGFACMCGQTLPAKGVLRCSACGRTYSKEGVSLKLQTESRPNR